MAVIYVDSVDLRSALNSILRLLIKTLHQKVISIINLIEKVSAMKCQSIFYLVNRNKIAFISFIQKRKQSSSIYLVFYLVDKFWKNQTRKSCSISILSFETKKSHLHANFRNRHRMEMLVLEKKHTHTR